MQRVGLRMVPNQPSGMMGDLYITPTKTTRTDSYPFTNFPRKMGGNGGGKCGDPCFIRSKQELDRKLKKNFFLINCLM
jgi:hypothetical protein